MWSTTQLSRSDTPSAGSTRIRARPRQSNSPASAEDCFAGIRRNGAPKPRGGGGGGRSFQLLREVAAFEYLPYHGFFSWLSDGSAEISDMTCAPPTAVRSTAFPRPLVGSTPRAIAFCIAVVLFTAGGLKSQALLTGSIEGPIAARFVAAPFAQAILIELEFALAFLATLAPFGRLVDRIAHLWVLRMLCALSGPSGRASLQLFWLPRRIASRDSLN
jgi:hypothetical protein